MEEKNPQSKLGTTVLIGILLIANLFVWPHPAKTAQDRLYFLDVGQGDSALLRFSTGESILIDAGPDRRVISSLEETDLSLRHIDLAILSHPQLDHFNGFRYLLDKYSFGAFIVNGRNADGLPEWEELMVGLKEKNVPIIVLEAGDKIALKGGGLDIIGPPSDLIQSAELNDTALITLVKTGDWSALFMGDAGKNIESAIHPGQLDILKVGHHGSKYSTGAEFLREVRPRIALIGVGSANNYGHPASSTIRLLGDIGASVFRTDKDGTIAVYAEDGLLKAEVSR